MARTLIRDTCAVAAEIMDGMHDESLSHIQQAIAARMKNMFRPGSKVVLNKPGDPLHGKRGVVLKVNPKRIAVGLGEKVTEHEGTDWEYEVWSDGEYLVPPSMLTIDA